MNAVGYILIILLFIGLTPCILLNVSHYSPITNAILHGILFLVMWEIINSLVWLNIYEGFEEVVKDGCYHDVDCVVSNYCPHIEVCKCLNGKCKRNFAAICNDNSECASGKCITTDGTLRCM